MISGVHPVTLNYKQIIFFSFGFLVVVLYFVPFSLYDQDGYWMWAPVISQYLKGDEHYTSSPVIFNGQNLAGIYGQLPFWRLFRQLQLSFIEVLNLTHAVFIILFSLLIFVIISGFEEKKPTNFFMALFVSCLSPIIVNRLYAGHLNLLFGILPFFVFLSLIYEKSFWHQVLCFFSLLCAMSTQAFQLLAYHILFVPLLFSVLVTEEKNHKRYFKISIFIFLLAFLGSLPATNEMLSHAMNPDSLRGLNANMVYSYIVMMPGDLIQLFVSALYPSTLLRGEGFYHEVSYPLGIFILLFFFCPIEKKIKYTTVATFGFLLLFTMGTQIGRVFSEFPLVRPFRVPQRAFMILNLFIPVWCLRSIKIRLTNKEILIFIPLFFFSQLFMMMDITLAAISGLFFFNKKDRNTCYAIVFGLLGLCSGSAGKIMTVLETDSKFKEAVLSLQELQAKYSVEELERRRFHFQSDRPLIINAVAQSSGIATLEGYGHPPKHLLEKLERVFGIHYSPRTNSAYILPPSDDTKKLKEFGVDTIVRFHRGKDMEIEIEELK